jgi:hypothetical protein
MHIEDLAKEYGAKSDEELLRLASESEELTQMAQLALAGEIAKRRINVAEHLKPHHDEEAEPKVDQTEPREAPPSPRDPPKVSRFVAQVLTFYHNHFWLFVKLIAPAVIIGYLAVFAAQHEVRGISRHLPRGIELLEHYKEIREVFFLNQFGFLVSWLAFSSGFGAICSAVRQIEAGVTPYDSFAVLRARAGPFLRLSLVLYLIMLTLFAAAIMLGTGILWLTRAGHVHFGPLAIRATSYSAVGLALLVLSRFGLAIPALVLDNLGIARSMFRSDELTEGTWSILAALLAKSVVGGYIVGMLPFWIASYIPRALLPSWFPWLLDAASIAGVIVVEPTMFIGFALLYERMSTPA